MAPNYDDVQQNDEFGDNSFQKDNYNVAAWRGFWIPLDGPKLDNDPTWGGVLPSMDENRLPRQYCVAYTQPEVGQQVQLYFAMQDNFAAVSSLAGATAHLQNVPVTVTVVSVEWNDADGRDARYNLAYGDESGDRQFIIRGFVSR